MGAGPGGAGCGCNCRCRQEYIKGSVRPVTRTSAGDYTILIILLVAVCAIAIFI